MKKVGQPRRLYKTQITMLTESLQNKAIPLIRLLFHDDRIAFSILNLFSLKELLRVSIVAKSFYELAGNIELIKAVHMYARSLDSSEYVLGDLAVVRYQDHLAEIQNKDDQDKDLLEAQMT